MPLYVFKHPWTCLLFLSSTSWSLGQVILWSSALTLLDPQATKLQGQSLEVNRVPTELSHVECAIPVTKVRFYLTSTGVAGAHLSQ
jgi:hypothetical protein